MDRRLAGRTSFGNRRTSIAVVVGGAALVAPGCTATVLHDHYLGEGRRFTTEWTAAAAWPVKPFALVGGVASDGLLGVASMALWPFDLIGIGPVGGAEFCTTGKLSSPVAKQMYTSPDLWPPVTHNLLRAFHYLGGSQELLEKVGADWHDGGPRLACDRTMLRLPYEPTRYPKADPPPDWPVMSTSTRTSAELLVLLVGLASIDNLLRLRGERRAA